MHIEPGEQPPAIIRLWSLREEVTVETGPAADHLNVISRWGEIELADATAAERDLLNRLSLGPMAIANVAEGDQAALGRVLDRVRGLLVHSLGTEDVVGELLSAVPVSPQATFTPPDVGRTDLVRLSRFAAMRTASDALVLESPLARYRVVLHRPLAAWVVGALGSPITVADLADTMHADFALITAVVSYLVAASMVAIGERDERSDAAWFAEDRDPGLTPWSHHDLLFHSRSRMGRQDDPLGAVYRYVGTFPPLPAVKPVPEGRRFPLHKPMLEEASAGDPSLTGAIERRDSVREFAEQPLSAEQVGELLYRTARIRSLMEVTAPGGVPYMISDRPYPSSDSLYELELYVTVDRCAGLPRGIYHYDPLDHALTLTSTDETDLAKLLDDAAVLIRTLRRPAALITMTARIARLSWVYDGIAYSTALKHVGVLQQTLYLVATAMGLGPCALAIGDSDVATRAFGLDWPAEVSIGEFAIGLRLDRTPAPAIYQVDES
ncbi:MAG TPA: SagB family peptide dehydrogenase [Actinophytocola sp.]|uniref:SagB family peptide dehydrogenase n=1 Tax=Actinophytocola sp. TaxID=1872138 RepID=UPI002DDD02A4|nr:SagB family peptide dehydrogenase [Actinophytocola sp.]HEV2779427.1 SagB family peptide dehydrogenase [Actinophytocola sp.]